MFSVSPVTGGEVREQGPLQILRLLTWDIVSPGREEVSRERPTVRRVREGMKRGFLSWAVVSDLRAQPV